MRSYGVISTQFWVHPHRKSLTTEAKLLYVYLISGPHATSLGCYRLSLNYIADDLAWSLSQVKKAIANCERLDLIKYDAKEWVFIKNFLHVEKVENPNQWRGIKRLFEKVPPDLCFYDQLIKQLLIKITFISDAERADLNNRLESLSKPFRNQEQEQKQEHKQDQKQNHQQEQKQYLLGDQSPNVVYLDRNKTRSLLSNHQELKEIATGLLRFLNEKANRVFRPVETNLKLIMARLSSGATETQCRQIIAKKTREWGTDAKMAMYLRPATLFNAIKFEQYVGELVLPRREEIMPKVALNDE